MDKLHLAALNLHSPDFDQRNPAGMTLDAYQTPTEHHHAVLRRVRTGLTGLLPWFALLGTTGAGKTMLAHGMALERIIRHADQNALWYEHAGGWHWKPITDMSPITALAVTYHQLIQAIRHNPRDWRETRRDFWTPILIIDEVREIKLSDFEAASVDELLNLRYKNRMCTIFISNLYEQQFWPVLGDRIKSRFSELGRGNLIGFTAVPDWRGRELELPAAVQPVKPVARRDANVR